MQRDGGPGGAGGAGNPTGGSFTGPAETLEIIGDHCYCFPGQFSASTTPTTRMSFQTGNYYTVGTIRMAGMVIPASSFTGCSTAAWVLLNDTVVVLMKTDGAEEDMPFSDSAELIIPPYTQVVGKTDAGDNQATYMGTLTFTGRIYRG